MLVASCAGRPRRCCGTPVTADAGRRGWWARSRIALPLGAGDPQSCLAPCRGSHAGWAVLVSLFPGPRRHVDRRKGDMNAYPPEEAVPAEPGGPVVLAVRAGRGLL